jgi:von Willebrand factor A domain-containing protein 8
MNEEHVGGNQWQGGTGGSDTAGLGGRGGPVRACCAITES